MALHEMTLSAVYDDVASTLTIVASGGAHPAPPSLPDGTRWQPQGPGQQLETVINVREKTGYVPQAWAVTDTSSGDVLSSRTELWEYRNGAWQNMGEIDPWARVATPPTGGKKGE